MDQESEKTRAELLDELTGSREDFFSPEAVEAIFPLLPGNGSEKLSVEEAKRLEREYLLLCGRGGGCVADTTAPVSHSEHLENEEDGSAPGVKGTGFEPLCGRLVEASDEGGVDALYQAVADEAAALMEVESSLLAIVDAEGDQFTYRGAAGPKALPLLGETDYIESTSVCGWVLRQGTLFIAADVRTDLRGGREIRDLLKARSVAAAPLDGQAGGILGAIAVASSKSGVCLSGRLVRERLLPFARHVSAVLSRSRPLCSGTAV